MSAARWILIVVIVILGIAPVQGADLRLQADLFRESSVPWAPGMCAGVVRVTIETGDEAIEGEIVVGPVGEAPPTRVRVAVEPETLRIQDLPFAAGIGPRIAQEVFVGLRGASKTIASDVAGRKPLMGGDAFWRAGGEGFRASRWTGLPTGAFPRHWLGYWGGGAPILGESRLASMAPEEASAFWKWITAGGGAIIFFDGSRRSQPAPPLPIALGPVREIEGGKPGEMRARRTFDVPSHAEMFSDSDGLLAAVVAHGLGSIAYVAEHPADPSIAVRAGFAPWAEERFAGLNRTGMLEPVAWAQFLSERERAERLKSPAPTALLFIYLAAIAVVLGPVQAIALRVLRRPTWTWCATIVLALAFSVAAVVATRRFQPFGLRLQSRFIAYQFPESPYAVGLGCTQLFSDGNRRYTIAFPPDSLPICTEKVVEHQPDVHLFARREPRIADLFVPTWTWARFLGTWVMPKIPGLRAVVEWKDSEGGGRTPAGIRIEAPEGIRLGEPRLASPILDRPLLSGLGSRPFAIVPIVDGAEGIFRPRVEGLDAEQVVMGVLVIACEEAP
ncbi:MAG: hypothetical protein JXP34_11315 [Planctomycetes bacterium]|nr:hypothetical protein [Planctomycetota bacterium]